jgi:general secretion pathway protein F
VPVFAYKGLDARGKQVTGNRDAESPKTLRTALRRDGISVLEVTEARGGKGTAAGKAQVAQQQKAGALSKDVNFGAIFQRVKRTDVAAFTRQLATLLRAGITLAESLGVLVDQIETPKWKGVVADVRTRVNEGSALADAMAKHPAAFEEVYVSMVRAGETAGNLDTVLERLADFMESAQRLRSKVVGAMVYPAVMIVVAVVIMGVLMVAVVPQITQLFADNGETLKWNTRLLVWTADVVSGWWWAFLILGPLAAWGFMAWTRSPEGRAKWDRFKLRAPVLGPLVRQIAVARFVRTLGTMLSSGVPLLKALDVSKEILGNHVLKKVVEGAREQIQQGESIAATLRKSGEFPSLVTHMIAVGERAGQLEQMLGNIANTYDAEAEMKLARLTSLMEPLIIVLMGGGVAFVVFSILMPIMEMNQFAQ